MRIVRATPNSKHIWQTLVDFCQIGNTLTIYQRSNGWNYASCCALGVVYDANPQISFAKITKQTWKMCTHSQWPWTWKLPPWIFSLDVDRCQGLTCRTFGGWLNELKSKRTSSAQLKLEWVRVVIGRLRFCYEKLISCI